MLTEVVRDFAEDVGDCWSLLPQGVTEVLLVFRQAVCNQRG